MSGQWQPFRDQPRPAEPMERRNNARRQKFDPLQRVLERGDRCRMHLHKCKFCETEVICLTLPCIFRATQLEVEWTCGPCKLLRDQIQLAGDEGFEAT